MLGAAPPPREEDREAAIFLSRGVTYFPSTPAHATTDTAAFDVIQECCPRDIVLLLETSLLLFSFNGYIRIFTV